MADGTETGVNEAPNTANSATKLLIIIVALIAVAAIAYSFGKDRIAAEATPDTERYKKIMGMVDAPPLTLAEGYTDGNDDLVADLPSDVSQIIDPETLVFTYIAEVAPEGDEAVWADFVAALSKATGRPVEHKLFKSREDQLAAMKNGELHISGMNTGAVPSAVNEAGFVPAFSPAAGGESLSYNMVFIAPAASGLTSPSDIAGNTLTLTDPSSNSGFKAPLVLLSSDYGLEIEADYQSINSFSHEASIKGIADGKFAVAATASDILERMIADGEVQDGRIKIIGESSPYPVAVLGYAHNLTPDLQDAIRRAFAEFVVTDSSVAAEYSDSSVDGFTEIDYKEDFSEIRVVNSTFR